MQNRKISEGLRKAHERMHELKLPHDCRDFERQIEEFEVEEKWEKLGKSFLICLFADSEPIQPLSEETMKRWSYQN